MKRLRGISVRQPFVEQIFLGTKKFEYRSRLTHVRERVYIYASKRPRPPIDWRRMKVTVDRLPLGKVVGTVEIVGCQRRGREYAWKLEAPRRLRKPVAPKQHPQPIWFYPFGRPATKRT